MNPQNNSQVDPNEASNTNQEALLQVSMDGNQKRDEIAVNTEGQLSQQMETNKKLGEVTDAVDVQTEMMHKAHTGFQPSLESMGKAMDLVSTLIEKLEGPKGEDGKTPIKGSDYFTESEVTSFKKEVTPIKGEDYFTEKEISTFKDAVTPIKGKDYHDGLPGIDGTDGTDGRTPLVVSNTAPKDPQIGDLWYSA